MVHVDGDGRIPRKCHDDQFIGLVTLKIGSAKDCQAGDGVTHARVIGMASLGVDIGDVCRLVFVWNATDR